MGRRQTLAIDAAIQAIVRTIDPTLTSFEMHKRGGTICVKGSSAYSVTLDSKPVATVTLHGDAAFTFSIL